MIQHQSSFLQRMNPHTQAVTDNFPAVKQSIYREDISGWEEQLVKQENLTNKR